MNQGRGRRQCTLPSFIAGMIGGLAALPCWELLKRFRPKQAHELHARQRAALGRALHTSQVLGRLEGFNQTGHPVAHVRV